MSQIVIFNVRDFTLVLLRCMLLMLKVYYWKQNKNLLSMIWCVCEMSTNNFHVKVSSFVTLNVRSVY